MEREWMVDKNVRAKSIKTKVLVFLSCIAALFLFSNLYSIRNSQKFEKQLDRLVERYYTINEFISAYNDNMELWKRYQRDKEENSWSMFVTSGRQLEELLARMVEDAEEMSEAGYLHVQSIRNLYLHYSRLARAPLEPRDEMKRELQLWEISELMKRYTEELLQDNLTFGNSIHEDIRKSVILGQRNAFLLVAVVVGICLIFGRYMTRWLLNPIQALAHYVREVGRENFAVENLPVKRSDEIGQLNMAVNQMKDSMNSVITTLHEKQELTEQLYRQEMELEKARFAALQSQINPHFLFNTLNVICGMADMEGAGTTGELIHSLSRLFRYSLENRADRVPMFKELTMVRDYIYIEKKRFGDRLTYILKADADLEIYEIPAFTLQPLVENSIRHGILVRSRGGVIAIRIMERAGNVVIQVVDNGAGMEKEKKQQLLQERERERGQVSGIGVANVFHRLRMMYPNCSIRIIGRKGRGTCVEIKINAKECRKHEDFDC